MAYRYGDRYQLNLIPQSIEEYVAEDNPVRAYDAFIEALNFQELGINLDACKVGNSEYDPKSMLKLLVYGYSYGVKSSRKLERECCHNLSFIWLVGGLRPDHKTIAEFRRHNRQALKKVLRHCARICMKLDLVAGNVLFVDGTKIRANAGRDRTHDRDYYEKHLAKIDRRIAELLSECEAEDRKEKGLGSYVVMNKELSKAQNLQARIKDIIDTFSDSDRDKINQSDADCTIMRSVQGSHAAYNVQSVVDDKHGLIVHAEAVGHSNDSGEFARQINQANELFETPCETACADAGYADTDELEKIDSQGITVIVPSQRQALHEPPKPFSKENFTYDAGEDCYICPSGHKLRYSTTNKENGKRQYRMEDKKLCHSCPHFGACTSSERGRNIVRLRNEALREKLERQYEEESSQQIYARRKTRAEHPFGHIKRNLKTDAFLMRGRDGVNAETSVLATCFNIARMITIYGVGSLIARFAALKL